MDGLLRIWKQIEDLQQKYLIYRLTPAEQAKLVELHAQSNVLIYGTPVAGFIGHKSDQAAA